MTKIKITTATTIGGPTDHNNHLHTDKIYCCPSSSRQHHEMHFLLLPTPPPPLTLLLTHQNHIVSLCSALLVVIRTEKSHRISIPLVANKLISWRFLCVSPKTVSRRERRWCINNNETRGSFHIKLGELQQSCPKNRRPLKSPTEVPPQETHRRRN